MIDIYNYTSEQMDLLQKKTVKELRSVLREYKKIHCKPYSRLKKAQMIELIKHHGISEHDIEKTGKIKTQSKPKSKIKSIRDEHDEIIKKLSQSRTNAQRTVANADYVMKKRAQKEMLTIAEKSKKRQQNIRQVMKQKGFTYREAVQYIHDNKQTFLKNQ